MMSTENLIPYITPVKIGITIIITVVLPIGIIILLMEISKLLNEDIKPMHKKDPKKDKDREPPLNVTGILVKDGQRDRKFVLITSLNNLADSTLLASLLPVRRHYPNAFYHNGTLFPDTGAFTPYNTRGYYVEVSLRDSLLARRTFNLTQVERGFVNDGQPLYYNPQTNKILVIITEEVTW